MATVNVIGAFHRSTELTTLSVPISVSQAQENDHGAAVIATKHAETYFPRLAERKRLGKFLGIISRPCTADGEMQQMIDDYLRGALKDHAKMMRARDHILACPPHQLLVRLSIAPVRIVHRSLSDAHTPKSSRKFV